MTDEELDRLAVEYCGGNAKAFNEIKWHLEPELRKFTLLLTGNKEESIKITTTSFEFIRTMEKKCNTITNIKACLYYNARNKSLAYLKSQRKK